MHCMTAWVLVIVVGSAILVAANGPPPTELLTEGDIPMLTSSMEMEGKPPRPRLFQSPEQIRMYLDSLGKYYNYQNRNRFGKRGSGPDPYLQFKDPYEIKGVPEYDFRSPL